MDTTSNRMAAFFAQARLNMLGLPTVRRVTESYVSLDFGPLPKGAGRFEVRAYDAGAAVQFIVTNGDDSLLVDFQGEFDAAFPSGVTAHIPLPVHATMQPDAHGRRFVYGNWSLAAAGYRFRHNQFEEKCAMKGLLMVELALLIHPIALKV
jgi:hypothetical protein